MELLKQILSSFGYTPLALILGIICQILAIKFGEPHSPNMFFQGLCFISFGWILFQIIKNAFFGK